MLIFFRNLYAVRVLVGFPVKNGREMEIQVELNSSSLRNDEG